MQRLRTAVLAGAMVTVAAAAGAMPAHAATRAPLPRLAKVGNPPATLAPGGAFVVRFRAVNRSRRTSARVTFTVRLVGGGKRLGLPGNVTVPALKSRRTHRGSRRYVLPGAVAPGRYRLVACVKRSGVRAVCDTAARALVVPGGPAAPEQPAPAPQEPSPAAEQPSSPPEQPSSPPPDTTPPSDTTAPAVAISAPAEGAELTGHKPLVSGTAGTAAGDQGTVKVTFSGAGSDQTVSAAVADDGAWSVRPDADLAGGSWTAVAEQRDNAGNTGSSPARAFDVAAVMLAAGDIAGCEVWSTGDEATATLLDGLPGDAVAPLGDNVYEFGTLDEFNNCYGPNWGRHKARTRPAIGNHEYATPEAAGYFDYFGTAAGDRSLGYYSYNVGQWHVVVLNSNCSEQVVVGCTAASAQAQWLRDDLAANPRQCTLAYWHHPRFHSSTGTTPRAAMAPLWAILDDAGAELVLNGHAHVYERFAPQDSAGLASATGLREFVVGVGGRSFHSFGTIAANSEVRQNTQFGVLELTLRRSAYDWRFVPVAGGTFADSGSAACT